MSQRVNTDVRQAGNRPYPDVHGAGCEVFVKGRAALSWACALLCMGSDLRLVDSAAALRCINASDYWPNGALGGRQVLSFGTAAWAAVLCCPNLFPLSGHSDRERTVCYLLDGLWWTARPSIDTLYEGSAVSLSKGPVATCGAEGRASARSHLADAEHSHHNPGQVPALSSRHNSGLFLRH